MANMKVDYRWWLSVFVFEGCAWNEALKEFTSWDMMLTRLICNQHWNAEGKKKLKLCFLRSLHAYTQFVTNTGSNVRKIVFQASNESLIIIANRSAIYPFIMFAFNEKLRLKELTNKKLLMATKRIETLFELIYSNDYDRN